MNGKMHIPDGFLNVPTAAAAGIASIGCIRTAVKRTRAAFEEKQAPIMGMMAAFIFAAQMINFPVAGGTSGHLIGAMLAAVTLGPWAAVLIMSSIVIIQAFFFADGGILVLGANILNMAVIGNFAGYYIYKLFKTDGNSISKTGIIIGCWISVVAAALAASFEIAAAGNIGLMVVLPPMLFWHAIIGIGEGVITLCAVEFIFKARGDLVKGVGVNAEK
ncbi:MAG: energy-coupling factor ABC transporter permease [Bacillota bacterium]